MPALSCTVAAAAPPRTKPPETEFVEAPEAAPELVHLEAAGLTAEAVGKQASLTSYRAKAMEAHVREAAAHVDEAWVQFLPRLTVTGRYTRFSKFTQARLLNLPNNTNPVVSQEPPVELDKAHGPLDVNRAGPIDSSQYRLPVIENQYLLQVTAVVPISDILLRATQVFAAASHAEDAARLDAALQRSKANAEGKIAYYTWLRAKGAQTVANLASRDQKTHLRDQKNLQATGNAGRAELLRAEAAVAASALAVERANDFVAVSEKQVRLAMHVPDTERIVPAEGFDIRPPTLPPLAQATKDGLAARLELKSLDASAKALRAQARGARLGALPQLGAFGNMIDANPNPRTIPAREYFIPTWEAGLQLSWSPNDAMSNAFSGASSAARADAVEAERAAAREAIELEIMQAYHEVRQTAALVESSRRDLASAEETYRAARQLFSTGRIPSTSLTDAESDLTRARLGSLNASIDARIAKVKLDHALGNDLRSR